MRSSELSAWLEQGLHLSQSGEKCSLGKVDLQVSQAGENQTDVIILTHDTVEGKMNEVLAQMQALPTVMAPITKIRKEELN